MVDDDDDDAPSPYHGLAEKIRGGPTPAAEEYRNRPPLIEIVRPSDRTGLPGKLKIFNLFGMLVALFDYQVYFDDQPLGALPRSSKLSQEVTAGEHTLQIKTPVANSRKLRFQIENGQRLRFSCQSKLTGIILQRHD